ncbi:universal stress protein [Profundibacter sp.]
MGRSTHLVVVDTFCSPEEITSVIQALSSDTTHMAVLVLGLAPEMPISTYSGSSYGVYAIPAVWQEDYAVQNKAAAARAEGVETILQNAGVEGDVVTVFCEMPKIEEKVAVRAKLCNLALLSKRLITSKYVLEQALDGILFRSPVAAIVNNTDAPFTGTPKHPFIAWNGDLPATRAVHHALPFLRDAEEVTVAVFDPVMREQGDGDNPGSDVATWLSRQGCKVTVQQYPGGGKEIGDCIVERAIEIGSDLVVMGAYGHSRLRQRIFGGTTRMLLEQTKLPVLFAH